MSDNETVNAAKPTRRALGSLLVGSAVAGGAIVGAIASDHHLDAALIALGKELEAAWAKENAGFAVLPDDYPDDAADALIEPCSQLSKQIMALEANTIEGLRVKAMAIHWCWHGRYDPDDPGTTAERIEQSIVRDLLAI